MKKIFIILLCMMLLFPPLSIGETKERTTTFTKYLPNGNVETFKADVGGTSHAIAEKCSELVKDNMFPLPQQIEIFFIISAGSGLHFSLPPSFIGSTLLNIHFSFFPSVIYCSYTGNESSTDIIPILSPENATTITGSHKILIIGFMGIVGWEGVFSFSDTGFAGFAFYVWTS